MGSSRIGLLFAKPRKDTALTLPVDLNARASFFLILNLPLGPTKAELYSSGRSGSRTSHPPRFYDAAVSGADPIDVRPGFADLLARIADNGVRTIIVETANRFARDLMVQEVGLSNAAGPGRDAGCGGQPRGRKYRCAGEGRTAP
jgi:Resolvase, N terminal domain